MIKKYAPNLVLIKTKTTSLLLQLEKSASIVYLGPHRQKLIESLVIKNKFNQHASSDVLDKTDTIFSSWSDGADLEPMVQIEDSLGIFVNRFQVDSYHIDKQYSHHFEGPHSHHKDQTLVISYIDETRRLKVEQYISTHLNSEALVFSLKITNLSSQTFKILKAMSMQIDFEHTDNQIYTLDGMWGAERNIHDTEVKTGLFAVKSASGYSSNIHNPFVIVRNAKTFMASNLIYSGSHAETLEVLPIGKSRFMTGINKDVFSWNLGPNKAFVTPEAVVTFGKSVDDVSMKMHEFVKFNLLQPKHQTRTPHVLLNSWEGIYFAFDRAKIINLARQAKELGVDLFVLDDGWFGQRDDDTSSLGDWFDYEKKTGGLQSLAEEIKAIDLKFGLWFEPEMINRQSSLYQNHPDFAMEIPSIRAVERRHQLMLDFARSDVREHIFKQMCAVIDHVKPDYLKLDANRVMSDMYSQGLNNHGEYQHRYVLGLYEFWGKLVARYPHILVEACSSGGNRFDLGTLFYFPQIWASDNTDALSRIHIQEGTLLGYPQSTMGTHVSQVPNATTNRYTPLESRFNIASIGAFGYEMDLTHTGDEEKAVMKKQVDFYRQYGALLCHGVYTPLSSGTTSTVYAYMIKDKKQDFDQAIIMVALLEKPSKKVALKLKEFNNKAQYTLSYRLQDNLEDKESVLMMGSDLNQMRLDLSQLYQDEKAEKNDTIASRMIVIKKVK